VLLEDGLVEDEILMTGEEHNKKSVICNLRSRMDIWVSLCHVVFSTDSKPQDCLGAAIYRTTIIHI